VSVDTLRAQFCEQPAAPAQRTRAESSANALLQRFRRVLSLVDSRLAAGRADKGKARKLTR
jgi:hypothetical protein